MNCKYCHSNEHIIDKCPSIICKLCKKQGHPQWLCTKDKNLKKNNIENKYNFSDDLKKKNNDVKITKDINYYLKLKNTKWSEIT